jgi:hypothetical protein
METAHSDDSLPALLERLQVRENSVHYEGHPKDDLNIPGNMLIISSPAAIYSFNKADIVESEQLSGGRVGVWVRSGSKAFLTQSVDAVPTTAKTLLAAKTKTGYLMDINYTENFFGHKALLEVNCSNSTWKLFDARLLGDTSLSGSHKPPGIEVPGWGIQGTGFWLAGTSQVASQMCFGLIPFVGTFFDAVTNPVGRSGTGAFVNKPTIYGQADNLLTWTITDHVSQ